MDFQFLFIIPVIAICCAWHKTLPPIYNPTYPQYPQQYGSDASGVMVDDFPWQPDDSNIFQTNFIRRSDEYNYSFIDDFCATQEIHIRSFEDDMFDPACSYLSYNIYHREDDIFSSSDISISNDISIHND